MKIKKLIIDNLVINISVKSECSRAVIKQVYEKIEKTILQSLKDIK